MECNRKFSAKISAFFLCLFFLCPPIHGAKIPNVYSSHQNDEMQIALTFDDGPHPRYTPQILEILAKYGICATFFVIGKNADTYPSLVQKAHENGHEIANHTYTHLKIAQNDVNTLTQELSMTDEQVEKLTGSHTKLFRPPEGFYTPEIARLCNELGYKLILWNIDTKDWAHHSVVQIVDYVKNHIKSGDILLFHDFIGKDSPTPQALEILIPYLLGEGYRFVTVSELLSGVA